MIPGVRTLSVGVLTALMLAAGAPARAAQPTCLTPVSPGEPPCNPHLADSGWGASHRGSYAQGASPFPAPQPGDEVVWQQIRLGDPPTQVPIVIDFSSPYPDGSRVAWMSVVSNPDIRGIHKVDVASGEVIDSVTEDSGRQGSITGAYNLLDRDNHLFVGRERSLDVFADSQAGDPRSAIAKAKALALPDDALCGADDRLVGITMTYDGHIAFASERGAVGVVPRDLERFDAEHLETLQLNEGRCDAPADELEIVSNSIAADEKGGIYVVTSKRMHRVQWDGRRLTSRWVARYEAGGPAGGVRLGDGSGSTPDVMGTSRDRDRFVVITDGQDLMHLVLLWRDRIPRGWEPIGPGKDPRIACEIPVTFGDPQATTSSSEQSVLTSGYTSVVVNNKLANEAALAALPPAQRQIAAALAGQDPVNAPYGLERIDWDPRTRTCASVWANREVSIPNSIPTLSTHSGLVYGQGQRNGAWGLEGVDLATGASALRVPASPLPDSNSTYAATEVGPDGAIWQGVAGGIDVYRGPARPGPELACFDLDRPALKRVRARRTATGRVRVQGIARDRACGKRRQVAVRVRAGGRTKTVRVGAGGRAASSAAAAGARRGRFALTLRVPASAARVRTVARDRAGLRSARVRARIR